MNSLQIRFEAVLDRLALPGGTVLVAVSGGPDSIALLDLASQTRAARGFNLRVAHFDHGIAAASETVARAVAALAQDYHLPVDSVRAGLGPATSETRARNARMAWFRALLAQYQPAILMTAHHADDQVETVLMRFLKGSGPAGLAGIAEHRGSIVRPLLTFSRAELAAHVHIIGAKPWTDPANSDPRHLRGWVRHTLVPALRDRLPRVEENLLVARRVYEEDRRGWDGLVSELKALDFRVEPAGTSVAAHSLVGYSSAVVRSLLRAVGRRSQIQIGSRELDRLQTLIQQGHTGKRVDLRSGAQAEYAFGRLQLFRPAAHLDDVLDLGATAGEAKVGSWQVAWGLDTAPEGLDRVGFRTWLVPNGLAAVRSWRRGDRIRPLRGRGSRLVVRCMQDRKIPSGQRSDWPILVCQDEVVWVPGVCRGDGLVPTPGTRAMWIDARPS